MSDHLPECIWAPQHFDPEQNIVWDGKPCICEQLRACEQRVREEWHAAQSQAWEQEYAFAVSSIAALEALDPKSGRQ